MVFDAKPLKVKPLALDLQPPKVPQSLWDTNMDFEWEGVQPKSVGHTIGSLLRKMKINFLPTDRVKLVIAFIPVLIVPL